MNVAPSERAGVCLGKALSGGFDAGVEAEEYRRMAAVEDEMWFYRALHAHIEREVAAFFGGHRPPLQQQREERSILDAGCGTGGLIRRLAPRHETWRWTGIDLAPLACELARARCAGLGAEIVEGSVTALPWAEASFDAVVAADVLYHLDDDAAALREIFRVLRPGGIVVVNVPAHRWLWSYHDVAVHGRRRYTRGEVKGKLAAAGFVEMRATHWNTLPLPLVWARRKLLPAPRSGSDVRRYPRVVEAIFSAAMALERAWLAKGGTLAMGSSILATARKAWA